MSSLPALRLSALRCVEENVSALLSHLRNSGCSPSIALHPQRPPSLDVILYCPMTEFKRAIMLQQIERLYNASTEFHCLSQVDVIPALADADESTTAVHPVTAASMTESLGFVPIYRYIAVGGTFDRLHAGHKLLLTVSALHCTEKLRVGITGPELLAKKKYASLLETFETRSAHVREFLGKLRPDLQLEIEPIHEFSGGTDRIADVEALVASPETLASIPKINALRLSNGLRELDPIPIHFIGGETPSVSSSMLRELEDKSVSKT